MSEVSAYPNSRIGRDLPLVPFVEITAGTATQMAAAKVGAEAGVTLLKKALDLQSSSALQLLQTLPPPPQAEGKGAAVDSYA